MDGLTDGEMNTLALRGLEEPAHASRGLEEPFFQLCCCVSFWFWREIGFVFWFWREIVRDHYYDWKKKVLVVCLAGALSLLRPEKKSSGVLEFECHHTISYFQK